MGPHHLTWNVVNLAALVMVFLCYTQLGMMWPHRPHNYRYTVSVGKWSTRQQKSINQSSDSQAAGQTDATTKYRPKVFRR